MGYTKREFLKLLGLTTVMLPFISCYDLASDNKKEGSERNKDEDSKSGDNREADLEVSLADLVLMTRNDQKFEQYNSGFNKRIKKAPQYIAVCKTEKGVQYAVRKAAKEGLEIAVRSGGHSFEGFSSNDGGMVINLSLMKGIKWLDNEEVELGPGWILQEIQDAFFPKGRLLPAGSCGTVGISGLTLGGGYGFFSRKFGLTCDSLLQVKMVAADGKIYDSDQDKKLLWACKGGGNGNFGVITSFKFKTYALPPSFSSYVFKFRNLNMERFKQLLDTWFETSKGLPVEAFSAFVLNGKTLTVLVTNYEVNSGFEGLLNDLMVQADSFSPSRNQAIASAMKKYYGQKGPIFFKNASGGLYRGKEDLDDIKEILFQKVVSKPGLIFQINTLGGNIEKQEWEQNSCYPHRKLPYLSELQAYWSKENQESGFIAVFEEIQSLLKRNGISAHYRNYPDIQFRNWEESYYGGHYKSLQQVKKKYDMEDLFHYEQSIRLG